MTNDPKAKRLSVCEVASTVNPNTSDAISVCKECGAPIQIGLVSESEIHSDITSTLSLIVAGLGLIKDIQPKNNMETKSSSTAEGRFAEALKDTTNENKLHALNNLLTLRRDVYIRLEEQTNTCMDDILYLAMQHIEQKFGFKKGVEIMYNSLRSEKAIIQEVVFTRNNARDFVNSGTIYFSLDISFYTDKGAVSKKVYKLHYDEIIKSVKKIDANS